MAIPKVLANFETSLASKISATATTLTLVANTNDDGDTLSGVYYLTIDEGTSSEEHMIVTLTGASGAIGTRGISRVDAKTLKTANRYSHDRGASVKLTNLALIRVVNRLNGDEAFDNVDWDGVRSIDGIAEPLASEETKVASVKYVNDVAIAGANDATATAKGVVELATEAETLAGTDTGETGASLVVLPSQLAKNIQNAVYSYKADEEASDSYAITLSPAPTSYEEGQIFAFKANTANTGACTLNVNALGAKAIKKAHDQDLEDGDIEAGSVVLVIYDGTNFQMQTMIATMPTTEILSEMSTFFGNTDITGAEAETLTNGSDANALHGHLTTFGNLTKDSSSDTTTTIAHGLGRVPKLVRLSTAYTVNNAISPFSIGAYNGTANYCTYSSYNTNGNIFGGGTSTTYAIILGRTATSTGDKLAGAVTVDATNITITWTKTGTPDGTFTICWEAF